MPNSANQSDLRRGMFARARCSLLALALIPGIHGTLAAQQVANEPQTAAAHDWPQFLGPDRNGISRETGLLNSWPPKTLWRVPAGVGMSGLAISRGRLVTLLQRSGRQLAVVLDAKTGKSIREIAVAPEYRNTMGDGPRSTPTIVDDTVYVFSGEGILLAADLATGRVRWKQDVVSALRAKPAEYGMACSPLVVGDQVIVTAGSREGTIVAYDCSSGKQLWRAGSDTAGYSSPAILSAGGQEQIVVFTGKAAMGLKPRTGEQLWRYPYITDYDCNIATPIAYDGQVFISSGENHGCALLGLQPDGAKFQVSPAWTSFGPGSVMRNEWQTSIQIDGHLYGLDNVGGAGPVTHLNCVDVRTGHKVWQERRFGKSNVIAADGKLWLSTLKGDLVVVRATPERYQEIGRTKVLESTRQAPALSAGRLYLRDEKQIVCLDVR